MDTGTITYPGRVGTGTPAGDARSGQATTGAPGRSLRQLASEQLGVAAGQVVAGVGNLAFAVIAARVLEPKAFAGLAGFLALYLLLHVPAGSLSAGSAHAAAFARTARWRVLAIGLVVGVGLVAVGLPASAQLEIPRGTVFALAAAAPGAGLLALERGALYGEGRLARAVASLVAEPIVRLGPGVLLAVEYGVTGAAIGATLGGYAALAAAALRRRAPAEAPHDGARTVARRAEGAGRTGLIVAFLLLAVVQNQDVLAANGLLPGAEAARFAAISTLGMAAAFATTTVPLVLLARAAGGESGALAGALLAAVSIGSVALFVAAAAAEPLVTMLFGERYAEIAPQVVPYTLAMALLGVARVFVADRLASGRRTSTTIIVATAMALQLALMLTIGDSANGLVMATLIATGALTVALGAAHVADLPRVRRAFAPAIPSQRGAGRGWVVPLTLGALVVAGVALRLAADRSLWLDEATTWYQSRLPFGVMLDNLRSTDVHPPLHHTLVWLCSRAFGDSEAALRLPSLIAGVSLIPMVFVAGRALYDRRTGLVAAVLVTIAPIVVWYSQEARMYALLMLLAVVAVWALHRAIETGGVLYWAPYALASAAMIWTHYFALLLVLVLEAALVVMVWRRRRWESGRRLVRGAVVASVAIAVLCAPLAPFAIDQFMANEAAGKGFDQPSRAGGNVDNEVSVYAALTNGIWAVWGYHSDETMERLAALWPMLMLFALLLLGRGRSRATYLLIAVAMAPALLLTGLALAHPFLFELRYNLAAVPLLLLLGARLIASWPSGRALRWGLGGLAAITLLAGVADQQLNGRNPRIYDFEGALAKVAQKARPGDLVLYDPETLDNVVEYYRPDLDKRRLEGGLETDPPGRDQRVFVLSSFRDDPRNVQATDTVLSELRDKRELLGSFSRPQVRVWEFG